MKNNKKDSAFLEYMRFYLEGDFSKYKYSFFRSLKIMPKLIILIFCIASTQIICLEYNVGIPVLNNNIADIVEKISYAYIASFIFYFLIEVIPKTKKIFYQNKLIKRKIRLFVHCFMYLNDYLHGIILTAKGSKPIQEILEQDYLLNKFTSGKGWKNNLLEFEKLNKSIIESINDIINTNILNDYLYDIFDYINVLFENIMPKKYIEEEDISERKKYVDSIIELYPEIENKLLILTKEYKEKAN